MLLVYHKKGEKKRENKKKQVQKNLLYGFDIDYSALIALVGQAPIQLPQSIQSEPLISKTPPASAIHPVGHSPAQAPHPIQSAVIT